MNTEPAARIPVRLLVRQGRRPDERVLPQRSLHVRALRHSGAVLQRRGVARRLPYGERRAAVHRLRSDDADRPLHSGRRRRGCRSRSPASSSTRQSPIPTDSVNSKPGRRMLKVVSRSTLAWRHGAGAARRIAARRSRAARRRFVFRWCSSPGSRRPAAISTPTTSSRTRPRTCRSRASSTKVGVRGGVYIGVGPDQNFSYIALIRPSCRVHARHSPRQHARASAVQIAVRDVAQSTRVPAAAVRESRSRRTSNRGQDDRRARFSRTFADARPIRNGRRPRAGEQREDRPFRCPARRRTTAR